MKWPVVIGSETDSQEKEQNQCHISRSTIEHAHLNTETSFFFWNKIFERTTLHFPSTTPTTSHCFVSVFMSLFFSL
jgi:hypothetical protein